MKLAVLHNFDAIKGEVVSLNIGYNNLVEDTNLFACVRKYPYDEEYKVKFSINVSTLVNTNGIYFYGTATVLLNALLRGKLM